MEEVVLRQAARNPATTGLPAGCPGFELGRNAAPMIRWLNRGERQPKHAVEMRQPIRVLCAQAPGPRRFVAILHVWI